MAVYFVQDSLTGYIKIGFSSDPWARLSQIQVHNAGQCAIIALEDGDEDCEADLHARFAEHRLRGEWFLPANEIMEHIGRLPPVQRPCSRTSDFWGGMSARDLARATGISAPMLSRIQKGDRKPSPEYAIRIQKATGISAIALVFGDLAGEAR